MRRNCDVAEQCTVETLVYKFEELSDRAKQRALDKLRDTQLDYDWWDCLYDDAKTIGLKIEGFDCYRHEIDGKLTNNIDTVIKLIRKNHGKKCATYKLATKYAKELAVVRVTSRLMTEEHDYDSELSDAELELEEEFKRDLLQEYLKMLDNEAEYLTSDEGIKELIDANDYDFDEDGNLE